MTFLCCSKNIFIFHCSEVFKTVVSAFFPETLQCRDTSVFLIFYLSIYSFSVFTSSVSQSPNISGMSFLLYSSLSTGNLICSHSFSHHLSAYNYYIYFCSSSFSLKFLTCVSNFLLNISTVIFQRLSNLFKYEFIIFFIPSKTVSPLFCPLAIYNYCLSFSHQDWKTNPTDSTTGLSLPSIPSLHLYYKHP